MVKTNIVNSKNTVYIRRRRINYLMLSVSAAAVVSGLFWLLWIIITLIDKGGGALSFALLTQSTPPPGEAGGLINAVVGSFMMAAVATIIGAPIGVLAGTYLAEFGQRGWFAPATRFLNDVLLSAPSIVIGLFIYAVYVAQVGHYSGWAGAFALAIIVIPVVVRSTDNMLMLVPDSLREAAAALGCPQWRIIMFISYKTARSGIITGVLLAVARISGETAPLLFTALNNQFMSFNMNAPIANLPVVIYQYAASPFTDWNDLAWAGAVLITMLVLAINIFARTFFRK